MWKLDPHGPLHAVRKGVCQILVPLPGTSSAFCVLRILSPTQPDLGMCLSSSQQGHLLGTLYIFKKQTYLLKEGMEEGCWAREQPWGRNTKWLGFGDQTPSPASALRSGRQSLEGGKGPQQPQSTAKPGVLLPCYQSSRH